MDERRNSSKSKVSRSYAPLSFYMDSAVNDPDPILKLGKNSVPLSLYPTTLVYHPARDPTGESKMDIFVTNKDNASHPLSFYMDPTVSHSGCNNYIPLSAAAAGDDSSPSKSPSTSVKNIPLSTAAPFSKSKVSTDSISIPDHLAFSVLSKLHVKSLKRFGCVCKSWSVLFENTDFMTTYSNHFVSRHGSDDDYHTFILTNHYLRRRHRQSKFYLLENNVNLNLPSPLKQRGNETCILGSTSVNGIFCLGQYYPFTAESQYVLWNPVTDEFMVIPSSPAELPPIHPNFMAVYLNYRFHGFGYDQLRDDFKLVQYVSFISHHYPRLTRSFFEIYSLKSNSWRMIDMDNDLSHWDYIQSKAFEGHEVYLDGACHWLAVKMINNRLAMVLLSFDLSDEVFFSTPIGEAPCTPYKGLERLTVLNGSIALITNHHDDIVFQISILGELGVSESWIKLYTYGPLPSIQWPPIGFGKMGYLFVTKKDYEVAYVDLSTQIIEEVGISGEYPRYIAGLYKESLLSLEDQVTNFSSSSGSFHP